MRKVPLANEEYYHIFNRGVDKREVFMDIHDYNRFLLCMDLLNDEKNGVMENWRNFVKANPRAKLSDFRELSSDPKRLVEYNTYCLNPNHIHFGIKQIEDNGIQTYMHKISTSYTNYFNKKYDRSGCLFQGTFKSVHIDTNEYFLYVSVYINANHFIHGYEAEKGELSSREVKSESLALLHNPWPYSSLPDYLGRREGVLCDTKPVLDQFKNIKEYEKFVTDNALYMKEKKEMEKYMLE